MVHGPWPWSVAVLQCVRPRYVLYSRAGFAILYVYVCALLFGVRERGSAGVGRSGVGDWMAPRTEAGVSRGISSEAYSQSRGRVREKRRNEKRAQTSAKERKKSGKRELDCSCLPHGDRGRMANRYS